MMKKSLIIGLIICMMCALIGCGNVHAEEKPKTDISSQDSGNSKDNTEESEEQKESEELSIETLSKMSETSKDEFVYFAYEGVVSITEFIGNSECVVIPDEIDGCPVVEIGDTAFRNNFDIKAVRIGNNVKKVGVGAFANCSSLEYVLFGNSVESIGEAAFSGCGNVKEIKLNEGLLTIGHLGLCNAEVPTVIPRSVIEIGLNGLMQPVKVYKDSYALEYVIDVANSYANAGGEFVYEIIE